LSHQIQSDCLGSTSAGTSICLHVTSGKLSNAGRGVTAGHVFEFQGVLWDDALGRARHRHCIGVVLDHHTRQLLATSNDARCPVNVRSSTASRDAVIGSSVQHQVFHDIYSVCG